MVTKRIGKASDAPTVPLGDGCDLGRPRRDSLLEDRVRVCDRQDHPDRYLAGARARIRVLLKPEVGLADRHLRYDNPAGIVLEAVALHRTEGSLVEVERARSIAYREPRGDAGLD